MQGLTNLSECDSNGLICIDPKALWRISRYSHGSCQRLEGDLVATATAQGTKNRLMYDNQEYDHNIIRATGITIKTQNRLFAYEYLQHVVLYCISNKKLLSANFRSDIISARIDKFSTKMC